LLCKQLWQVELQIHSFFTSTLEGGERLESRLEYVPWKEVSRYPVNRRLVGSKSLSWCYSKDIKF